MARVLRVVNRNSYKSRVHQCSMCEGGRGGFSVGCLRLCFFFGLSSDSCQSNQAGWVVSLQIAAR